MFSKFREPQKIIEQNSTVFLLFKLVLVPENNKKVINRLVRQTIRATDIEHDKSFFFLFQKVYKSKNFVLAALL